MGGTQWPTSASPMLLVMFTHIGASEVARERVNETSFQGMEVCVCTCVCGVGDHSRSRLQSCCTGNLLFMAGIVLKCLFF